MRKLRLILFAVGIIFLSLATVFFAIGGGQMVTVMRGPALPSEQMPATPAGDLEYLKKVVLKNERGLPSSLAHAPAELLKGLPKHPVPSLLLARLAVTQSERGQGLGQYLLLDAFRRCIRVAHEVAVGVALVQRALLGRIAHRRARDAGAIGGHLLGRGDAPQQDVPRAKWPPEPGCFAAVRMLRHSPDAPPQSGQDARAIAWRQHHFLNEPGGRSRLAHAFRQALTCQM